MDGTGQGFLNRKEYSRARCRLDNDEQQLDGAQACMSRELYCICDSTVREGRNFAGRDCEIVNVHSLVYVAVGVCWHFQSLWSAIVNSPRPVIAFGARSRQGRFWALVSDGGFGVVGIVARVGWNDTRPVRDGAAYAAVEVRTSEELFDEQCFP